MRSAAPSYRPELDGVRGIAILLVVLAHAHVPGFRWGGLVGVTLFFVLSGYLITGVLMREADGPRREVLLDFYWHRIRRLLPALAVFLCFALLIGWASRGEVLAILFYFGNWVRAAGGQLGFLGHTWSLAVEEQFYLVWPLVFLAGFRSVRIVIALAVAIAVLRALTSDVEEFGTHLRLDGILAGCAMALAGWRAPSPWLGVALIAGAAMVPWPDPWFFDVGLVVAVIGSVILVTGARPGALSSGGLVWLGAISYALYLWHFPLLTGTYLHPLVAVALAVLIAYGSTRFVEAPIRRLRRPFTGTRDPELASPPQPA